MERRINLVPTEQRRRTRTDFGLLTLVVFALALVGAMAFGYFSFSSTVSNKEAEKAELEIQNTQLQAQIAALRQYDVLDAQRASLETLVGGVYRGRTLLSEIIGDLSLVIPENVWLTQLSATTADPPPALAQGAQGAAGAQAQQSPPGSLTLVGNTYSFEDVATFLVRLEQIKAVGTVTLGSAGNPTGTVDPSKGVRGFDLEAVIRNLQAPDTQLPLSQVEVEQQ